MTLWLPRRRAAARAYADGFHRGYSATRREITQHAAAACASASPAGAAEAWWLGQLADRARQLGQPIDQSTGVAIPPPPAARLYRTPLRTVVRQLRRRYPERWPLTVRIGLAGLADGTVAARLLTTRQLVETGKYTLTMPTAGQINGQPASGWLDQAALRWRMVDAQQPQPLPGTTAATIYHALAGRDWFHHRDDQPGVNR